ncbi:MAG: hypothetical protein KAU35_02330 [candidate division Zixibacteria bacterium]|nr:hypothetical protein [candidate division Zixibacteria bacterium]
MVEDVNVPMPLAEFQRKYARGVLLFILGFVVSWLIANHYHGRTSSEHRAMLIDNVLFEMELNEQHWMYKPLVDTAAYRTTGRPFQSLLTLSLEQLYQNVRDFPAVGSDIDTALSDRVAGCLLLVTYFNNVNGMRTDVFIRTPSEAKELNALLFGIYHDRVLPEFSGLREYLEENRTTLIG